MLRRSLFRSLAGLIGLAPSAALASALAKTPAHEPPRRPHPRRGPFPAGSGPWCDVCGASATEWVRDHIEVEPKDPDYPASLRPFAWASPRSYCDAHARPSVDRLLDGTERVRDGSRVTILRTPDPFSAVS